MKSKIHIQERYVQVFWNFQGQGKKSGKRKKNSRSGNFNFSQAKKIYACFRFPDPT